MLCNSLETAEHLLFTCPTKLNMWKHVCAALNIKYQLKTLVLGVSNFITDWAISVLTLCFYKYWSWSNKVSSKEVNKLTCIKSVKQNMQDFIDIYRLCNFSEVSKLLEIIYCALLVA